MDPYQVLRRLQARHVTGTTGALASDEALAYVLLHLTVGVTMLIHGTNRIGHGPEQFAAVLVRDFAPTILPEFLVHLFALTLPLPFLEAALGVLLIPGLLTRLSLVVVRF